MGLLFRGAALDIAKFGFPLLAGEMVSKRTSINRPEKDRLTGFERGDNFFAYDLFAKPTCRRFGYRIVIFEKSVVYAHDFQTGPDDDAAQSLNDWTGWI